MRDFSFNNTSSLKSTLFGHKLSDPLSLSLPLLIFATHALALTHALSHSLFSNFLSLMSKSNTHMSGGKEKKVPVSKRVRCKQCGGGGGTGAAPLEAPKSDNSPL